MALVEFIGGPFDGRTEMVWPNVPGEALPDELPYVVRSGAAMIFSDPETEVPVDHRVYTLIEVGTRGRFLDGEIVSYYAELQELGWDTEAPGEVVTAEWLQVNRSAISEAVRLARLEPSIMIHDSIMQELAPGQMEQYLIEQLGAAYADREAQQFVGDRDAAGIPSSRIPRTDDILNTA